MPKKINIAIKAQQTTLIDGLYSGNLVVRNRKQ